MTEQYLKPYPVCRWAQPAIEAALSLRAKLGRELPRRIVIHTFHEAARLAARAPADTEQAQYSLPFPVAAAFVHGKVGAAEIDGPGLEDAAVLALGRRIELAERDDFNARFPAERWAEVEIEMADGQVLSSGPRTAAGDPEDPLSDEAVEAKFHEMAGTGLDEARRAEILGCVRNLGEGGSASALVELLMTAGAPRAVAESA